MKSTTFNILALGAAGASALTTSPAATNDGCNYNVPGLGSFNTRMYHDFTAEGMSSTSDLEISTYTVEAGNSPLARRFDLINIGTARDGALTLTVPGGQTKGPISSAQLVTAATDVLYGSVRTVAMISGVAGTTNAMSFYANDNQETDIAYLTGDTSLVHFTNEQVSEDAPFSSYVAAAPRDASSAYHEYRMDWSPKSTNLYIDGVLVQTLTDNVPSTPGFLLWNAWSNGNSWAKGPPAADSVMKIKSVQAYFNRTSTAGKCATAPAAPASKTAALCPNYNGTTYTTDSGTQYVVACNYDFGGGDLKMVYSNTMQLCMEACQATAGCVDAALSGTACYMKNKLTKGGPNGSVNSFRLASLQYPPAN